MHYLICFCQYLYNEGTLFKFWQQLKEDNESFVDYCYHNYFLVFINTSKNPTPDPNDDFYYFLLFLEKEGVLVEFFQEVENNKNAGFKDYIKNLPSTSKDYYLYYAFDWSETKMGLHYWNKINFKYKQTYENKMNTTYPHEHGLLGNYIKMGCYTNSVSEWIEILQTKEVPYSTKEYPLGSEKWKVRNNILLGYITEWTDKKRTEINQTEPEKKKIIIDGKKRDVPISLYNKIKELIDLSF